MQIEFAVKKVCLTVSLMNVDVPKVPSWCGVAKLRIGDEPRFP
jgi:hypothetical protein